jgi:pantothenate kinase
MQPAPSIELPNQDAEYVSHIALDIGGSLIKLVYFSPDPQDNGNGSNTLRYSALNRQEEHGHIVLLSHHY